MHFLQAFSQQAAVFVHMLYRLWLRCHPVVLCCFLLTSAHSAPFFTPCPFAPVLPSSPMQCC